MRSWIVSVGPNPGRGSSNAHGPVTDTGPIRVVSEAAVKRMLKQYYNRPDQEIEVALLQIKRGAFGD